MGRRRRRVWDKEKKEWTSEWVQDRHEYFRRTPVLSITYSDIRRRLREIEAKEGKYAARHAMAAIRSFFKWCLKEEEFGFTYETPSPVAHLSNDLIEFEPEELQRERVLDDDELRDLWAATEDIGSPAGELVRLLLLTGQRKSDWSLAERKELDFQNRALIIPKTRYKTKVDHLVPLGPKATEIVTSLSSHGPYLFSSDGVRPMTGLGWFKSKLDEAIEKRRGTPVPPFVIHDLRRTVRTRLSDLGIDILVGGLVLGHAPPGIRRTYDRSAHLDRKRHALEAWEALLLEIVGEGPSDKVVRLDRRRA